MRKFIISDIHGFGNLYYSVMSYLDNISKEEDIELYINGDLIDHGYESAEILLDVIKRIKENKFKIIYLGGNHELMMHEFFEKVKKEKRITYLEDWHLNGGSITYDRLYEILKTDDKVFEVANYVSNLKIYHKFEEKIKDKNIVLIHAACLDNINDSCNLKIKDNNGDVFRGTWTREYDIRTLLGFSFINPHKNELGNSSYFTIVGHTPNDSPLGFVYDKDGNYLNIDGGSGSYVSGFFQYNHFPLIEVCSGYLKIITFNSNNEIICCNYFDGKRIFGYTTKDMEEARKYINPDVKIKKLSRNEDGIVIYDK